MDIDAPPLILLAGVKGLLAGYLRDTLIPRDRTRTARLPPQACDPRLAPRAR
jgi:hypothetical protein